MNTIDAMTTSALLKLVSQIAQDVALALRALGLCANDGAAQAAAEVEQAHAPLYVATIEVAGQEAREMYDDHLGLAYFSVKASRFEDAPPYCGMARGMRLAEDALQRADDEADGRGDMKFEGQFSARSVILLDQFHRPVQELTRAGWQTDLPAPYDYAALLSEAERLDTEACEEWRWDNFESSRSLSERAAAIRRRLECAQRLARVIQ